MPIKDFDRYREAVRYIESLSNIHNPYQYEKTRSGRERFLKRTQQLLDLVGNPEKGLKVIHITGTAGKGSVSKLTQLMLIPAHKKVGLFTSPFATTSVEKIQINDKYISAREFVAALDKIKPALDKMATDSPYGLPAYFEIFFAIALLHFKSQRCSWCVIEVGMGGRYDATNIFPKPVVTAITMVDYDHTHLLGKTLPKITQDKAGIIKPGSLFFTTEQRPALVKIMHKISQQTGATFHHLALPPDAGHREANVALASMMAESLGATPAQIKSGEKKFRLPCRFELVQNSPQVVLDGAHNPAKIRATVADLANLKYKKLHLVFALGKTKDLSSIVDTLLPKTDYLYATRYLVDKGCSDPAEIVKLSRKHKSVVGRMFLDPHQALDMALARAKKDDVILVTGSFYLAGELRKRWYSEEKVVKNRSSF